MTNWKHHKTVRLERDITIMYITVSEYEWLHSVECHYDRNCTYCTNDSTVNKGIRYWTRKCVCRRNLPPITIKKSVTASLRSVLKWGMVKDGLNYTGSTMITKIVRLSLGKLLQPITSMSIEI